MPTSYNIYSNSGSGPIDYSAPVANTSSLAFTTAALTAGEWRFGVRATDGTLEEMNLDAAVRLVLDASLADVTNLPLAPASLSAWPIAGGKVRVTWTYPTFSRAGLIGFRVYAGVTTPDYGTPLATVPATSASSFSADLSGLAPGTTYAIGVRSYNAIGEEANTTTTSVTAADAGGPDAVEGLTISTDPADW